MNYKRIITNFKSVILLRTIRFVRVKFGISKLLFQICLCKITISKFEIFGINIQN
jgi:hypothetical protein